MQKLTCKTNYRKKKINQFSQFPTRGQKPLKHAPQLPPKKGQKWVIPLSPGDGSRFLQRQDSDLPRAQVVAIKKAAWPLQSWLSGPDNPYKKEMKKDTEQVARTNHIFCSDLFKPKQKKWHHFLNAPGTGKEASGNDDLFIQCCSSLLLLQFLSYYLSVSWVRQ